MFVENTCAGSADRHRRMPDACVLTQPCKDQRPYSNGGLTAPYHSVRAEFGSSSRLITWSCFWINSCLQRLVRVLVFGSTYTLHIARLILKSLDARWDSAYLTAGDHRLALE